MRIRFLLLNAYAVGGTVRTVVNQANALAAAGHDVEIASVVRRRVSPSFAVDPRVRLRPLVDRFDTSASAPFGLPSRIAEWLLRRRPSRLVPRAEVRYERFSRLTDRRLLRYLRSLEGGVLIATRPGLNLLAAEHAPPGVITVGQEHLDFTHHDPALAAAIKRIYPRLDAVTVLTEADERAYREALDGTGVRIARIPNPLAATLPVRSPLRRPLVVSAGRLVKSKGFGDLIAAFEGVVREHPEWQLRIYGSGPEKERLRARIHERHLYNHVYLMGTTRQLDEVLAQASMFVLSSRHEGFGMVLAEAMSHGVPVVSYDCPQGPREIIDNGRDGLLVPPRDVHGLTAAMLRLVEDEWLRRTMGGEAAKSSERYAVERVRERWEALFRELAAARDGGVREAQDAGEAGGTAEGGRPGEHEPTP